MEGLACCGAGEEYAFEEIEDRNDKGGRELALNMFLFSRSFYCPFIVFLKII